VRRLLLFTWILAAAALAGTAPVSTSNDGVRVVAIGDVHGAADAFTQILMRAGLIDGQKRWIGGRSILVQTGDMTDRGAGMKDALDLLMSLEEQARRAGGRVHALLGNHEVMNLTGDMRDVTPEIFASFGGEAAMRQAFAPKGRYGRWLRSKPAIAQIDGTVFMHAGINHEFVDGSISDINRRIRHDLEQWDEGVRWLETQDLVPPAAPLLDVIRAAREQIERLNAAAAEGNIPPEAPRIASLLLPVANVGASTLFHPEGPLWFRGFSTWTDEEGGARMAELLRRHRAQRFVTGHTVQPGGRITERFGRRLFLIDTGMLGGRFFPSGRPSALVLKADSATHLYLD